MTVVACHLLITVSLRERAAGKPNFVVHCLPNLEIHTNPGNKESIYKRTLWIWKGKKGLTGNWGPNKATKSNCCTAVGRLP
jgi:hypothetical protein